MYEDRMMKLVTYPDDYRVAPAPLPHPPDKESSMLRFPMKSLSAHLPTPKTQYIQSIAKPEILAVVLPSPKYKLSAEKVIPAK
jgi:hypothetical protein